MNSDADRRENDEEPDEDALTAVLGEEMVADYLLSNPDFFVQRPDILACMIPPTRWSDDSVADMQRYMVQSLRDELAGLRDTASQVIETSRSNMVIQDRTHAAVVTMLEAADLPALVAFINDELGPHLGVEVAALGLEVHPSGVFATGLRALPPGEVDRRLGEGIEAVLQRSMDKDEMLFAESAPGIRSAAMIRLHLDPVAADGLLVFGARDADAFHPQQGTELIRFLARIIALCLKRLLNN